MRDTVNVKLTIKLIPPSGYRFTEIGLQKNSKKNSKNNTFFTNCLLIEYYKQIIYDRLNGE
jgi:hypothetical protein